MELHVNPKYCWLTFSLHILSVSNTLSAYADDSPLFQPGNGALLRLSDSVSNTKLIENLDTFKYTTHSSFTSQSGSIKAFFVPPEDGSYSFPSSCHGSSYGIELTDLTYSHIQVKSKHVQLRMGFRYKLILSFYIPHSLCQVGVKLPNGTALMPIPKRYIFRAMDSYNSKYILMQTYHLLSAPPFRSLENFYSSNSGIFPENPSSFILTKRVLSNTTDKATLFLGYMETPTHAQTFRLSCDHTCEANITSRTGNAIHHRLKIDETTTMNKSIDIPQRRSLTLQVLIVGRGQLDVLKNKSQSSLYNIENTITGDSIARPTMTTRSPSALGAQLSSGTRINRRDSWVAVKQFEIACYREDTLIHHFKNITGSYPHNVVLSGLANYTTYKCNAYYYGKINGKDFNVASGFESQTTAENLPSAPPMNIKATSPQMFTIKISWNKIPSENHEGNLQYALFYRKKVSESWKLLRQTTYTYYVHTNLEDSYYLYIVRGETGAGYGPRSTEITAFPSVPRNKIQNARFSTFATSLHFTDKALEHHITAVYKVQSVEQCHKKCTTCQNTNNCFCLSFNIQHSPSAGGLTCEINHETAELFPFDLVQRDGYQHYTLH